MVSAIRVNFIVEGQTKETFVRRILVESLAKSDVYVSGARCIETGRKKIRGPNTTKLGKQEIIFRGGMSSFEKIRRDIKLWLDEDRKAYLTTMFDLYALHEFEGLLFSDVKIMDNVLKPYHDHSKLEELNHIRGQFNTPEEINDGFKTAPSKRIIDLFKSYQKVTYGYQRIGIEVIRRECPHFNDWMVKLGQLGIYGQIRS